MESEGGGNFKTKKIFVGGLPPTLTEDGFRQYFESYGHVTDVVVTQRPRGFGFITFDSEDAVDREYVKLILDTLNMFIPLVNLYANVPSDAATSELVTVDDELVTSVCWAPDGRHIAVGWNNSQVQIWDSTANRKLRTLRGGHRSGVGSMAWNNHILTTGGHTHEVCGLKWSPSGQQLASGGGDHLLRIWDRRSTQWLHTLEDHTAAVKALVWCPFRGNLLATGEGSVAGCIKFWNTHTGACLNSIDTGSQVSALLWNKNQRELLSSHGFAHFNRIR